MRITTEHLVTFGPLEQRCFTRRCLQNHIKCFRTFNIWFQIVSIQCPIVDSAFQLVNVANVYQKTTQETRTLRSRK